MAATSLKEERLKAEKGYQSKAKRKNTFDDSLILMIMLAKQSRLVKEKDFKKIFKRGKASYAKIFNIKVLANELKINRYGIVISAKVSKKSVERNKLKRQFREILKEFDKKLARGFDLVIIVFPAALNQDYKLIKNELEKVLVALKLFKSGKENV